MKVQSTVVILTLGLTLFACRRPSEQTTSKRDGDAVQNSTALKSKVESSAKWTMPDAMMQHVRNLETDVRSLASSETKDHAKLSAKIDGHTRQLIADCTMEGEGHDALHDWLMPFLQLNKNYAAASDATARSTRLEEIQKALVAFHERFE